MTTRCPADSPAPVSTNTSTVSTENNTEYELGDFVSNTSYFTQVYDNRGYSTNIYSLKAGHSIDCNLNGAFKSFSAILCRDEAPDTDSENYEYIVDIVLDNHVKKSFPFDSDSSSTTIDIDLTGVKKMTIDVRYSDNQTHDYDLYLVMIETIIK